MVCMFGEKNRQFIIGCSSPQYNLKLDDLASLQNSQAVDRCFCSLDLLSCWVVEAVVVAAVVNLA